MLQRFCAQLELELKSVCSWWFYSQPGWLHREWLTVGQGERGRGVRSDDQLKQLNYAAAAAWIGLLLPAGIRLEIWCEVWSMIFLLCVSRLEVIIQICVKIELLYIFGKFKYIICIYSRLHNWFLYEYLRILHIILWYTYPSLYKEINCLFLFTLKISVLCCYVMLIWMYSFSYTSQIFVDK